MVGYKNKNIYKKKRKGKPFSGRQRYTDNSSMSESTDGGDSARSSTTPPNSEPNLEVESTRLLSASRRKLNLSKEAETSALEASQDIDHAGQGYRLIDINKLSSSISKAHVCDAGHLVIHEDIAGKRGLMPDLKAKCSSCEEEVTLETSSKLSINGNSANVNRRAVYHSVESGGGYEGLASFCGMNMPCMTRTTYYQHFEKVVTALEQEAKDEMKQAAQNLREHILKENGSEDTSSTVDVAKCSLKKLKCTTDEEFEEWEIEHVFSGECDINFGGSSPAMEMEGAKVLWSRSLDLYNIRYRWMVSDGDSKAHSAVEEVYDEIKVEKLDCVGHVQKRMGKNLLNLKATTKGKLADGKTIGGRGRLTEEKIKKIQRYYGLAIRQNTLSTPNPTDQEVSVAVYAMKKNIIAILHHSVQSNDPKKQHRFCPTGQNSWCKWQQDQALGTSMYNGDDCLPEVLFDLLKPIFLTLSDSKLLERCRVMQRLAIPAGELTKRSLLLKDKKRVRKSDHQTSEKNKRRRQAEQLQKTRKEEALREAEGTTYC
ncbi:uncharacterized protein LOC114544628 [Dendronephthya gigantea]|uniref:uncharacterized protein LOC114544628 n=1 Tax=Dendronephthya gigantea TaxID=151771 RepID=UPI00106C4FF6|nr:uncharacterized protein LOC114544628 [Dendronephthya gigantea]